MYLRRNVTYIVLVRGKNPNQSNHIKRIFGFNNVWDLNFREIFNRDFTMHWTYISMKWVKHFYSFRSPPHHRPANGHGGKTKPTVALPSISIKFRRTQSATGIFTFTIDFYHLLNKTMCNTICQGRLYVIAGFIETGALQCFIFIRCNYSAVNYDTFLNRIHEYYQASTGFTRSVFHPVQWRIPNGLRLNLKLFNLQERWRVF